MWHALFHKNAPPPSVNVKKDTASLNKFARQRVKISQPLEKRIQLDREITEFEIQTMFSASALAFSMFMLATKRGDPGVYLPLITSIIGYWIPGPKKDDK